MEYTSTRNSNLRVSSAYAIRNGISSDGGLFVPTTLPKLSDEQIKSFADMSYRERAINILSLFLTDFTKDEIEFAVNNAYTTENFISEEIAPIQKISNNRYVLELFGGPTCAFKDMALQILPYLMKISSEKVDSDKEIVILTATSGDTGKAALEGFKNVDGTKIFVFYPDTGVSVMQKLQMATQDGNNVQVYGITGNFDDAQTSVKKVFTDNSVKTMLNENGKSFSSANSINWGRLLPQIVYYFSAYSDLVKSGEIEFGEKINVDVPTGNFGNILAAYYAFKMGLPIKKLLCASNKNNILTDFIKSGIYDKNRPFYTTKSPSMDILISSNLERLLFELYNHDDEKVKNLMESLNKDGKYEIEKEILDRLDEVFDAEYATEDEMAQAISDTYREDGYLIDTHTAVAIKCLTKSKLLGEKTVIASTASPFKFPKSVLSALGEDADLSDLEALDKLSEISKLEIPKPLQNLDTKQVRFNKVLEISAIKDKILEDLEIK
ncbi:MAG: threonine synthase [Clostridia bacterium]|nr:threonine synthase [Clostridia bacterium]